MLLLAFFCFKLGKINFHQFFKATTFTLVGFRVFLLFSEALSQIFKCCFNACSCSCFLVDYTKKILEGKLCCPHPRLLLLFINRVSYKEDVHQIPNLHPLKLNLTQLNPIQPTHPNPLYLMSWFQQLSPLSRTSKKAVAFAAINRAFNRKDTW